MHCIVTWLESQEQAQQCPMCRAEWRFRAGINDSQATLNSNNTIVRDEMEEVEVDVNSELQLEGNDYEDGDGAQILNHIRRHVHTAR